MSNEYFGFYGEMDSYNDAQELGGVATMANCDSDWDDDGDEDIENFEDGDVYDLDAFDGADPDDVDWSPEDEGG